MPNEPEGATRITSCDCAAGSNRHLAECELIIHIDKLEALRDGIGRVRVLLEDGDRASALDELVKLLEATQ